MMVPRKCKHIQLEEGNILFSNGYNQAYNNKMPHLQRFNNGFCHQLPPPSQQDNFSLIIFHQSQISSIHPLPSAVIHSPPTSTLRSLFLRPLGRLPRRPLRWHLGRRICIAPFIGIRLGQQRGPPCMLVGGRRKGRRSVDVVGQEHGCEGERVLHLYRCGVMMMMRVW